ncbi:MAG: hypothetical protein GY780_14700 [bacterium]|nr:hypothetical protein [bacterium]
MSLRNLKTPTLYIDGVYDLRPADQRAGEGHFLTIKFPKDESWYRPVAEIYAEALIQDVEQTQLVEVVSMRSEADYVLSAELLSVGCVFDRGITSFLLPTAVGMGAGMAFGENTSDRISTGIALSVVAILAIPMPAKSSAEAEIRLTLKSRQGDLLWMETCKGEAEDRVYAGATARQDQEYVDEFLTKAIKRCNACLLGQMRQKLLEIGSEG